MPNPRVTYREAQRLGHEGLNHGNASIQRVLEGVGEKIENNFFPHVAVNENVFAEGRAIHKKFHACAFHSRTKSARQIRGVGAKVTGLIGCFNAPRFNAREVQQRIDKLEQAQCVSVHQRKFRMLGSREPVGAVEQVFERT